MDSHQRNEFKPRGPQETLARRLGDALDQMDSRSAGACPDGEILAAYAEQGLNQTETEKWESHFATCSRCRKILQVLAVSADTPLAEKEVARLGELISVSHAPVEITERVAGRSRPGIAAWRTRWIAPAIGVAAVLAVWFVMRPPWRATDRGASRQSDRSGAKAELPMSAPPAAIDRPAENQRPSRIKRRSPCSPTRPVLQQKPSRRTSQAEPSAKGGADASSRVESRNAPAAEESKRSLQADKRKSEPLLDSEQSRFYASSGSLSQHYNHQDLERKSGPWTGKPNCRGNRGFSDHYSSRNQRGCDWQFPRRETGKRPRHSRQRARWPRLRRPLPFQ